MSLGILSVYRGSQAIFEKAYIALPLPIPSSQFSDLSACDTNKQFAIMAGGTLFSNWPFITY